MKLICPISTCQADVEPDQPTCLRCGTPMDGYVRVATHAARMFDHGLEAAEAGRLSEARDAFAAVVGWQPHDLEARNALALACALAGDRDQARHHWNLVAVRAPTDPIAMRGLAALNDAT